MPFDPETHHRRSIRLRGYDYSLAGAYFVTVCAQDRACVFGDVADGAMRLNDAGRMVDAVWNEIPTFYPEVQIDAFVVMPNHMHGIIFLPGAGQAQGPAPVVTCAAPVGAAPRGRPVLPGSGQAQGPAPTVFSLGDMVRRFKTLTMKRYADGVRGLGWKPFRGRLWQRNYFEHVIRDEVALDRIRQYIPDNPARWDFDRENPAVVAPEPEYAWRI